MRICRAVLATCTALTVALPSAGLAQPAELARRAEAEFEIGHGTQAVALWRQALADYRAAGDAAGQLRVLVRLGSTMALLGEHAEASRYLAEALALARHSGNASAAADVLPRLADAASRADDHPRAIAANR